MSVSALPAYARGCFSRATDRHEDKDININKIRDTKLLAYPLDTDHAGSQAYNHTAQPRELGLILCRLFCLFYRKVSRLARALTPTGIRFVNKVPEQIERI